MLKTSMCCKAEISTQVSVDSNPWLFLAVYHCVPLQVIADSPHTVFEQAFWAFSLISKQMKLIIFLTVIKMQPYRVSLFYHTKASLNLLNHPS